MENNIIVSGNSKEIIKDVLFQETGEIALENGRRVLGVTAKSKVNGCESLENELRVSVKTTFRFISCDESGNYYTDTVDGESMRTVSRNGITPTTKVCLDAIVTDCEMISGGKAKATVELFGWFIKEEELTFLNVCNQEINCKTEKSIIETITPIANSTITLTYTDEARMPISQIIDYSGNVSVDNVYPSNGTYRIEGDLVLRVVAITDNGQFITQNFSHPFSAENADESVLSDMRLEAEAKIKSLSFTVTDSDKRILVCDAVIKVCGIALFEREVEKAVDVYSINNEIEIKTETRAINSHFCMRSVREKATAMLSAKGGITEILAVLSPCVSVSGTVTRDGINAEGVLSATIVYLDENNISQSLQGEVPFISSLGGDYPCETVFTPDVAVTSLSARPRGSSDVEITAELLVTVRGVQSREITIISDVVIGEEKEVDDFAVSLYIVKEGETLWEVAKALNTDESTLVEQNQDILLPLKGGEKILLYNYLPE